jgi:quercetin dioxygenase-like cupin family protein
MGTSINPVRQGDTRRVTTPNATMTTLASPTLGGSAGLSLWQVEMGAGQRGPVHVVDSEQVWTVVAGQVSITVDGAGTELGTGDTLVLPAGLPRQIDALRDVRLLVCGHGDATVSVPGEDSSRGTPPWIS